MLFSLAPFITTDDLFNWFFEEDLEWLLEAADGFVELKWGVRFFIKVE